MITKERIKQGIDKGIVHFVVDPNIEHGTVCKIGAYWFYFGGLTAEEENPDEFLQNANINDIVNDIYDALEDFRKENPWEYGYYSCYLTENLNSETPENTSKIFLIVNFIDVEQAPEPDIDFEFMLHSKRYLFYGSIADAEELEDSISAAFESNLEDETDDNIVNLALAHSGHKWTVLDENDKIPACDGCYIINI